MLINKKTSALILSHLLNIRTKVVTFRVTTLVHRFITKPVSSSTKAHCSSYTVALYRMLPESAYATAFTHSAQRPSSVRLPFPLFSNRGSLINVCNERTLLIYAFRYDIVHILTEVVLSVN